MIARSRWRITVPPPRLVCGAGRTAVARAPDPSPEPYGQDYGAGPSRLPYEPPIRAHAAVGGPRGTEVPAPRTTRSRARALREAFQRLPAESLRKSITTTELVQPAAVLDQLGVRIQDLSRLELHTLLHELIRSRLKSVAVLLSIEVLDQLQPSARPRRVFAPATLAAMGERAGHPPRSELRRARVPENDVDPLPQPSIDEQRPHPLSPYAASLVELIEALQRVRHRRPESLYDLAVRRCLDERRPDAAAKVYVGLVEEWIIEGRIAEGADPSDFYRGGGPPREHTRSTPLLRLWFNGVRTWCLPGEALSPHDRLDLWHPHHHSLSERMRGFPMPVPTSPPTLVPHPSLRLVGLILNALEMDPRRASPQEYAASMRALATLANTVLSRTLPIPAVPNMLKAFSESHIHPAVYPESYDAVPEHDAWAYTANTQVHVALVSLMFSPPNYARAAEIERKFSIDKRMPPTEDGPGRYMLRPLEWKSCLVLIQYAARTLRQPRLLSRLFEYMKVTFKEWSPAAVNSLFRGATLSRDNLVASEADDALFGNTPLARDNGKGATGRAIAAAKVESRPNADAVSDIEADVAAASAAYDSLLVPDGVDQEARRADGYSVVALVTHLTATSQVDRLIRVVYTLIPYLAVSKDAPRERVEALAALTGAEISLQGRILPSPLSPVLYSAMVNGLAKTGHTGLAQRVFLLARSFENRAISAGRRESAPEPAAVHYTLPIHMYTAMMEVYGNEGRPRPNAVEQHPRGWAVLDPNYERLPRREAGLHMAWETYLEAMRRWRMSLDAREYMSVDELKERLPDARFFATTIRTMRHRWNLDRAHASVPLARRPRAELARLVRDMHDVGIPVPPGLELKLETSVASRGIYPSAPNTNNLAAPRRVASGAYVPARRAIERGVTAPE